MIAQLNHLRLFSPTMHQKPITTQNPFLDCVKIQCFPSFGAFHISEVSVVIVGSTQSPSCRFSRVEMTEAQDVLSDYLHSTRGYSFLDAEYISKNSPHFLQTLVSSIHVKEGVARSLRKFLRYNPINEFEPFLESLGVSPSELPLLMPRGMHFLSDDYAMLETFHALSNYGIPRNIMGKIYKEAREVFGYGSVLLSKKFRAYENLGLNKPTVIKLVSSCPELLLGDLNSEFAMVLDWLKKIGIENDWMGKYLSSERTYDWERMLDTIEFFDKVGYSGKHMLNLFKTNPALLFEGCGKMVYVLFGRLFKLGLKTNVIYSSFIQNPCLISNKCSKNLLRVVDFLYDIGMGSEAIAHIMSNHMQLLSAHSLKGPKTVCRVLKVKKTDLCQIISDDPLKLISLASKSKQKRAKQLSPQDLTNHMKKTKFLLKLGYVENSEEMEKALKKYRGRGDQLQERFDCLVAAGLDYNIVTEMIKRAPMILNQSKDIIEKKIDCLRNIFGYPLESLVAFPSYLCYDLERIIQRFSMYAWLKERGAAKPMLTLSTILVSSDERFVKYFVNVHPEGPNVWEGLKNLSPST